MTLHHILWLLVLVLAVIQANASSLDNHKNSEIAQDLSAWYESPYLVRIHVNQSQHCTGVLIGLNIVATVYENCLKGRDLSTLSIDHLYRKQDTTILTISRSVSPDPDLFLVKQELDNFPRIALFRLKSDDRLDGTEIAFLDIEYSPKLAAVQVFAFQTTSTDGKTLGWLSFPATGNLDSDLQYSVQMTPSNKPVLSPETVLVAVKLDTGKFVSFLLLDDIFNESLLLGPYFDATSKTEVERYLSQGTTLSNFNLILIIIATLLFCIMLILWFILCRMIWEHKSSHDTIPGIKNSDIFRAF